MSKRSSEAALRAQEIAAAVDDDMAMVDAVVEERSEITTDEAATRSLAAGMAYDKSCTADTANGFFLTSVCP